MEVNNFDNNKSFSVLNSGPGSRSGRFTPTNMDYNFAGNQANPFNFGRDTFKPSQTNSVLAGDSTSRFDTDCRVKDIETNKDLFDSSEDEVDDLEVEGAPPIRQVWFNEKGERKVHEEPQKKPQSRPSALQTPNKEIRSVSKSNKDAFLPASKFSTLSPDQYTTPTRQRSRSPSAANEELLNENGKHAYDSMERDKSHKEPVEAHESSVVKEIRKPLVGKLKVDGYVYILRDPVLELVKVGQTGRNTFKRMGEIYKCRVSDSKEKAAYIVGFWKVYTAKKLESLVLKDLQPHRWFFECSCRSKQNRKFTRHKEWFDVSDEVAMKTLHLWMSFVLLNPYGNPSIEPWGNLMPQWQKRLSERLSIHPHIGSKEEHDDHEIRIRRWWKLLVLPDEDTDGEMKSAIGVMDSPLVAMDKGYVINPESKDEPEVKTEPNPETEPLLTKPLFVPSIERSECPKDTMEAYLQNDGIESTKMSRGTEDVIEDVVGLDERKQQKNIDGKSFRGAAAIYDGISHPTSVQTVSGSSAENIDPEIAPGEPEANANGLGVQILSLDDIKRSLNKALRKSQAFLFRRCPEKTILARTPLDDIIRFRWSLLCAIITALCAPYSPPFLSILTWMFVLSGLLGEMREWW
ncbi:hypothetical protein M433DRAFT_147003 [Acidomyces richmondensis BFW]|nr:MAG: hypothetical protein FE78DRAFT_233664 [Acidomyces sp. 'richmondensis']KYG42200.1 hypothetical protein M433DRAFT_147003 [Acidomyces richmondensis BFW]